MENSLANRSSIKLLAMLSLVLFLGVITINALANILPINGVGTGTLSDEIPNLFVPAGLTFSIWGLIYLLLAIYVGAVTIGAFKGRDDWSVADGIAFSVNMVANIGWIFAWHYRQVGAALVIMLVILSTLVVLAERRAAKASSGWLRSLLLDLPIGVYLGWICVATIANVTALLVKIGWNGFGIDPRVWTVIAIAAGLAVGLLFVFKKKKWAPPLVVVWAYAGIVIKRIGVDREYSTAVWIAAAASAVVLLAAVAVMLIAKRRKA